MVGASNRFRRGNSTSNVRRLRAVLQRQQRVSSQFEKVLLD
jgi:hypothetical protein